MDDCLDRAGVAEGGGPRTKTGLEVRDVRGGGSDSSRWGWGVMEVRMRKEGRAERGGMESSRGMEREGRMKEFVGAGSMEASRVRGMAAIAVSVAKGCEGGSMDMVRERPWDWKRERERKGVGWLLIWLWYLEGMATDAERLGGVDR